MTTLTLYVDDDIVSSHIHVGNKPAKLKAAPFFSVESCVGLLRLVFVVSFCMSWYTVHVDLHLNTNSEESLHVVLRCPSERHTCSSISFRSDLQPLVRRSLALRDSTPDNTCAGAEAAAARKVSG